MTDDDHLSAGDHDFPYLLVGDMQCSLNNFQRIVINYAVVVGGAQGVRQLLPRLWLRGKGCSQFA